MLNTFISYSKFGVVGDDLNVFQFFDRFNMCVLNCGNFLFVKLLIFEHLIPVI